MLADADLTLERAGPLASSNYVGYSIGAIFWFGLHYSGDLSTRHDEECAAWLSAFAWTGPVSGIAAAIATLSVSALRQHKGNRGLWASSHWIMAIGIPLPVIWPHVATVFAGLLVGATFMVITLVPLQKARLVADNHVTVLIAAMPCAFAIGQIIGPMMIHAGRGGSEDFSSGLIIASVLVACSTLLLKRNTSKLHANRM